MRIEEITDDVAERLKVSPTTHQSPPESTPTKSTNKEPEAQQQQPPEQNGAESSNNKAPEPAATATATAQMLPELSPGRAMESKKTIDEVVADLKRSPFFMTELEENEETEALKALAYEGTPREVASDFKDRGNECFKARRWADAKEFYTKGVLVLAAEERKRKNGEPAAAAAAADDDGDSGRETGGEQAAEEEEEERQRALLEALHVNRAACHLELRNYRSCWLDGAAALRINDRNAKAYYRSARALLAAGRVEEADDACARGLAVDPGNAALRGVARDVIRRSGEEAARRRQEEERLSRERRRGALLKAALKARGIRTRSTARPPELEDARTRLVPDPDDPRSSLSFPAVFLYPAHLESDFVKAFSEADSVADHLAYMLPPPWDAAGEYAPAGVECYAETIEGGLVKVGKKAPLLRLLGSGKVEVVDEVVKLFVLPKAKAEAWVKEFKAKRAAERGGG